MKYVHITKGPYFAEEVANCIKPRNGE